MKSDEKRRIDWLSSSIVGRRPVPEEMACGSYDRFNKRYRRISYTVNTRRDGAVTRRYRPVYTAADEDTDAAVALSAAHIMTSSSRLL